MKLSSQLLVALRAMEKALLRRWLRQSALAPIKRFASNRRRIR
jgi:hypothetical protein